MNFVRFIVAVLASFTLAACQSSQFSRGAADRPSTTPVTRTANILAEMQPPDRPINVAVYSFPDRTGARRPNERYADLSYAVTQGADTVVVDALKRAGKGKWFNVVERSQLDHLLRERKLISDTYHALGRNPLDRIAPLQLADFIIQGAITSFESTVSTGGIGASYLGIGADANYRKDYITVALRLTRVSTGGIVKSITANKTIFSIEVDASLFKVISVDDILQAVATFTKTEVTQIAVSEAIELAVYQMITEAERDGLWNSHITYQAADLLANSPNAGIGRYGLKTGSLD